MVKLNSLHPFERAELVNLGKSCSRPDCVLILYCFLKSLNSTAVSYTCSLVRGKIPVPGSLLCG